MNKEQNFVSAVIYVHNAATRIERFLQTVMTVLQEHFEHAEIICVNDCSQDESVAVIRKASALAPKGLSVSIVNMSYFHGLEAAMDAGRTLAIGDFVYEFDNTVLDFNCEEIMTVYQTSLQGYDIVSASPLKKMKLTSAMFYKIFDGFTVLSYKMQTESFRILSRRVINRISGMNKTIPYRKALYANCGLKTTNLTYVVATKTAYPVDKAEQKYRSTLATDSLILFTNVGYSFAKGMTIVMILAALFVALYSVVIYLVGSPVEGWTTTLLFLSFSFFGLFAILTIVIKYLQLILNMVFRRKSFSFESVEKLTK